MFTPTKYLANYDYNKGRFSLRTFSLTGKEKELIIQLHKEGEFITSYETFEMKLIGLPFEIVKIYVDNERIDLKASYNEKTKTLKVHKNFMSLHIYGE
jgi:alpha-glucosidase